MSTLEPEKQDISPIATRVKPDERAIIDRAVSILGIKLSTFVRETLLREARDVVTDQKVISLDDTDWAAFITKLDEPPAHNSRFADLLNRPSPWEGGQ